MSKFYYADSSALIKRHVPETGSIWIKQEFDATSGNEVITSKLSVAEVLSGLNRRRREASILATDYAKFSRDFTAVSQFQYRLVDLTDAVLLESQRLLETHPLRAGDIRTEEQLNNFLSTELSWRKKELTELKSLIQFSTLPPNRKDVLIRSGIAILYAHWEGFIKNAATAYVEYVAMLRLKYKDLAVNFIALGMKGKLENASTTNKASIFIEATNFILNNLEERSNIPYKTCINTKSNLSFELFREIITLLDLDFSPYLTKETLIDKKLRIPRNNIAHGHYLSTDQDSYLELHEQVIELLDLFRNQIENAASLEKFKKN